MADFRDDSLLFSLRERVDQDAEARRREARIALHLRAERERLQAEAEQRRRQAVGEMLRLEEQRRREDEARLEALKQATIERARVEAEAKAQLEIIERRHQHERTLLEIRSGPARSRWRGLTALVVAQSAIVVVGLGLYLGKLRPDARGLEVAYDKVVSAERSRAEEAQRQLGRSEQKVADLAAELQRARLRIQKLEDEAATGSAPVARTPAPPDAPQKPASPAAASPMALR